MNKLGMETRCIQAGYTPGNGEPRQIPIIQSTTFKYATSEDMGKLFDLIRTFEHQIALKSIFPSILRNLYF